MYVYKLESLPTAYSDLMFETAVRGDKCWVDSL